MIIIVIINNYILRILYSIIKTTSTIKKTMNCLTFNFKNKLLQKEYNQSYKIITKKLYYMQNLIIFIMMSFNTIRIQFSDNKNIDKKKIIIIYIIQLIL